MRTLFLTVRAAVLWCLVLLLPGCIDPYMPDAISSKINYLVVDGFINSRGSTTITLSRTFDIASKATPPVESRATVYIEEEGATTRYTLTESAVRGTYASGNILLNPSKNYRLHILTSTGKDYASSYVPAKVTPPIDAVTWRTNNDGLNVYVNSHDDTNNTQFYQWDYEETWEIIPIYRPAWEYVNRNMRRIVVPYPTICWGNQRSSMIEVGKTTSLSRDVVADYRVRNFSATSERLTSRYSILVRQYALTRDEYAYWELLKKNTENIGTLFDPLPAQLTGNIKCLNDEQELALGYIGAHTVEQRRIFITRREIPSNFNVPNGYESCIPTDTVNLYPRGIERPPTPAEILQVYFSNPNYLPIENILDDNLRVIGYTAKSRDCIDCRTRGAAVKPSFWP